MTSLRDEDVYNDLDKIFVPTLIIHGIHDKIVPFTKGQETKNLIANSQLVPFERITDQHLVVGVDIAQHVHVARAVNYRGIVIGKPLSFENNEEGFTRLLNWIKELKRMKNLDTT
ncbi:hypothetical protein ACIROK_28860, partial [Peribacillus butanolivorans]